MELNTEIDTYIAGFPEPVRSRLFELRKIVINDLPNEAEEVISYGMPTYKYNRKILLHFGGAKQHVGLYPTPEGIAAFEEEFKKLRLKYAKGSVQLPLSQSLPEKLIKKILAFRYASVSDK